MFGTDIAPERWWANQAVAGASSESAQGVLPMTQAKRKRTHARASATGGSKRQARKTTDAHRSTERQRSAQDRSSSHAKSSARNKGPSEDESRGRRNVSESDPAESVESIGRREPRGSRIEEGVEEIDERSRRPGGSGDASFGDTGEGPDGPAR
jgi:hypothetical protein